jgi:hypothetical protein
MGKSKGVNKLDNITFKINEIKIDQQNNRGVVSVELSDGENRWFKPFGLNLNQGKIRLEDFKEEVQKVVKRDLERDVSLSELQNNIGKELKLFEKKE